LTNNGAVSDAYVQAVDDVANVIFLPENGIYNGFCRQLGGPCFNPNDDCLYGCECESQPLTETEANAAIDFLKGKLVEIDTQLKAKLPDVNIFQTTKVIPVTLPSD